MKRLLLSLLLLCSALTLSAQVHEAVRQSWGRLATRMPAEWYASDEAVALAEKVLDAQLPSGGWCKNIPWNQMTEKHEKALARAKQIGSSIFDNNATTTEMRFLAKVYASHPEKRYKQAFDRAFELIIEAQYDNGGWPMFYPLTEACYRTHGITNPVTGKNYISHINFNDNAMTNILMVLKQIYEGDALWAPIIDKKQQKAAKKSFYKGIQCILDCQIDGEYEQYTFRETDNGTIVADRRVGDAPLSIWCAQHDAETLEPAQARAYEFPSYCGGETAGLLTTLMQVDPLDIPKGYPTMWSDIQRSVKAAVEWLDAHRILDQEYALIYKDRKAVDRNVVEAKGNRSLWARFYELTTCRPIFGMYDFVRLYTLDEVSQERRMAYGWYSKNMERIIERDYPKWIKKHGLE